MSKKEKILWKMSDFAKHFFHLWLFYLGGQRWWWWWRQAGRKQRSLVERSLLTGRFEITSEGRIRDSPHAKCNSHIIVIIIITVVVIIIIIIVLRTRRPVDRWPSWPRGRVDWDRTIWNNIKRGELRLPSRNFALIVAFEDKDGEDSGWLSLTMIRIQVIVFNNDQDQGDCL